MRTKMENKVDNGVRNLCKIEDKQIKDLNDHRNNNNNNNNFARQLYIQSCLAADRTIIRIKV